MRKYLWFLLAVSLASLQLQAKVVVLWQPGFPTVASQPIDRASLEKALSNLDPVFEDVASLAAPESLSNVELLVLPYGSALPVDAWKSIDRYLDAGGNLLVIGGQPLRVPVTLVNQQYVAAAPQDTYSRVLGFRHTYEVPVAKDAAFHWRYGFSWMPELEIRAQRFFAVEGLLDGLGYMTDSTGQLVAAPVIVSNHVGGEVARSNFGCYPRKTSSQRLRFPSQAQELRISMLPSISRSRRDSIKFLPSTAKEDMTASFIKTDSL